MFGSGASRLRSSDVWTNKQRETRVIAREGAESSFAETENGRVLRTENSPEPGCLGQRRPSQQGPNPRQHWGERAKKTNRERLVFWMVVVKHGTEPASGFMIAGNPAIFACALLYQAAIC
jgi:hypothetical protein